VAKPTNFDGYTSWAVFRRQYETVGERNCRTPRERATYLIVVLEGWASDVLQGGPKRATYGKTLEALEDHFGDQHLAVAYRSQLNTRTQRVGDPLYEFATSIEQLAHRAYPALPEDHVRREAGKPFDDE
jgi:hypothetical protein